MNYWERRSHLIDLKPCDAHAAKRAQQIAPKIWELIRNPLPKMYPLNAPEKRCNRKRKRFHD